MKFLLIAIAFVGLIAAPLTSCGPGYYEQKLNTKIADHIEEIQSLNESISVAETQIKGDPVHALESPSEINSSVQNSFQPNGRTEFLLVRRQYEVEQKWLDSHRSSQNEALISALQIAQISAINSQACIRFSAENFQFSEPISHSNRSLFVKPSIDHEGIQSSRSADSAFGHPLDQFFTPQTFAAIPHGNSSQIIAAFDPDQNVLQLQINHRHFTNPDPEKIFFRDRAGSPTSDFYAMVSPDPKPPTIQKITIRMAMAQWVSVAAIPLSNDPNRVSLHFLKAIAVN